VTVTRALHELDRAWAAAYSAADALRLTVQEDAPRSDDAQRGFRGGQEPLPKPVEEAGDLLTEIVAVLGAGAGRLNRTLTAAGEEDGELDDGPGAVAFMQDRWLEATDCRDKLIGPEPLLVLRAFVGRHRGEWHGWWRSVLKGLEAFTPAARATDVALAQCWRELAVRPHVNIGTATVGRLRVRQAPGANDPPRGPRGEPVPLRPVPAAPTTGDH
jgi:hypothetical protein